MHVETYNKKIGATLSRQRVNPLCISALFSIRICARKYKLNSTIKSIKYTYTLSQQYIDIDHCYYFYFLIKIKYKYSSDE